MCSTRSTSHFRSSPFSSILKWFRLLKWLHSESVSGSPSRIDFGWATGDIVTFRGKSRCHLFPFPDKPFDQGTTFFRESPVCVHSRNRPRSFDGPNIGQIIDRIL